MIAFILLDQCFDFCLWLSGGVAVSYTALKGAEFIAPERILDLDKQLLICFHAEEPYSGCGLNVTWYMCTVFIGWLPK